MVRYHRERCVVWLAPWLAFFQRRGDPDHGISSTILLATARPVSQNVCGTDADHWLDAERLCGSLPRLFWSGEHFTAFAVMKHPHKKVAGIAMLLVVITIGLTIPC